MSEAENKSLARRLLEEVGNTGAVDRLPEFLASDCRMPHTNMQGLAWFREHLLTFHRCYPDMVITVDGHDLQQLGPLGAALIGELSTMERLGVNGWNWR